MTDPKATLRGPGWSCVALAALLALGGTAAAQTSFPSEHLQGRPVMLAVTLNDMADDEGTVFWQDLQGRWSRLEPARMAKAVAHILFRSNFKSCKVSLF